MSKLPTKYLWWGVGGLGSVIVWKIGVGDWVRQRVVDWKRWLVSHLIDDEKLKAQATNTLVEIIERVSLDLRTHESLQRLIEQPSTREKVEQLLIALLTNPELAAAVAGLVDRFLGDPQLRNRLNELLSDSELRESVAGFLTEVAEKLLADQQLMARAEDALSELLQSDELQQAGADGVYQTLTKLVVPKRFLKALEEKKG